MQYRPKLMVLSIDGVPIELLRQLVGQGDMPNLQRLIQQSTLRQMRSVQPTVSCVAWASYMTGKNPGKHGIYGFIDRKPGSYDLEFPNANHLQSANIWEILSAAGKRVFGMNVCTSYPPRAVNGILIGGFLSPSLDKATYPGEVAEYLQSIDYRLDSDAALARRDKKAMLYDLDHTLDARMEAMFHFLEQESWDFFHTHIMGSDRINHFLWGKVQEHDSYFMPAFFRYYRRIDEGIGKLLEYLGDDVPLLIFSDHGFCNIKKEVMLSRYLVELGWTKCAEKVQHPLSIEPGQSKAYCMIPGRIYVNLKGREPGGIVELADYQRTREQLRDDLLALRDPDGSAAVVKKVMMREELYWGEGKQPTALPPEDVGQAAGAFGKGPDLVAIPHDGYDLKLGLAGTDVFVKTELEGMHTYDNAFMVARDVPLSENLDITMVAKAILQRLEVDVPADLD
ncbi:MAG: alkaline phosphatase family protein [Sedimentisphaerales bacterium]|nr:alkaline phosphatase family protein [Sedimentisphaerales bacterium]